MCVGVGGGERGGGGSGGEGKRSGMTSKPHSAAAATATCEVWTGAVLEQEGISASSFFFSCS